MNPETEIAVIKTKMENLDKKVVDGFADAKKDHEELKVMILDYIKTADDKYSGKWVETIVKTIGFMFLAAIIGGLIILIFKNPVTFAPLK